MALLGHRRKRTKSFNIKYDIMAILVYITLIIVRMQDNSIKIFNDCYVKPQNINILYTK